MVVHSIQGAFSAIIFMMMAVPTTPAPAEDLIESLPLVGKTPTLQYSGFLNGTAGCDTDANGDYCLLHYWLAMAEDPDPLSKPVLLWLNGGPGASSILGFLQENGPFLMNATGGLMANPWSWTKVANMFVIESPIGVGYSYCQKQEEGGVCENTDKTTASTMRAALDDFFGNKFPEFAGKDFFITGESYAGVYIPTLSKEILDNSNSSIVNLVGIAVGDPCTDNTAQTDSMDPLWYSGKYGFVDEQIFDLLWNVCGYTPIFAEMKDKIREELLKNAMKGADRHAATQQMLEDLVKPRFSLDLEDDQQLQCKLAYRKYLWSSSLALSQDWANQYIYAYGELVPTTFEEDDDLNVYMNRDDVKVALHVEDVPITSWPLPDVGFIYVKQYAACNFALVLHERNSMIEFYAEIAPQLNKTWVYNGDADPCVSYEGTRTAMKRVGFDELDGGTYRPWFYNLSAASLDVFAEMPGRYGGFLLNKDLGAQFAGEVVNYEHGLSFMTVHGSGHMVPQFRPQVALHMIDKLVNGEGVSPLSPLMPMNSTLETVSDLEYWTMVNAWTETAKAAPYVEPNKWEETQFVVSDLLKQAQANDVTAASVWSLSKLIPRPLVDVFTFSGYSRFIYSMGIDVLMSYESED